MTMFLSFAFALLVSTSSIRGEESCGTCLLFAESVEDYIVNSDNASASITELMCNGQQKILKLKPENIEPCKRFISKSWKPMARRLVILFGNGTSMCDEIEGCSTQTSPRSQEPGLCDDCKSRVNNTAELIRTSNQANRVLLESCVVAVMEANGGPSTPGDCAEYSKAFPLALASFADTLKEQSGNICCTVSGGTAKSGICC